MGYETSNSLAYYQSSQRKGKKGVKKIFEEIMTESFPNSVKTANPQTQET